MTPLEKLYDGVMRLPIVAFIAVLIAVLAALDLGRSVSVMPEARRLVVQGLYRRIRHPLYLAEEIATIGCFLQFRSWQAALSAR